MSDSEVERLRADNLFLLANNKQLIAENKRLIAENTELNAECDQWQKKQDETWRDMQRLRDVLANFSKPEVWEPYGELVKLRANPDIHAVRRAWQAWKDAWGTGDSEEAYALMEMDTLLGVDEQGNVLGS